MDVLRLIVSFIGPKQYRFIALINLSFHAAYIQAFPKDTETKLDASTVELAKVCWDELKLRTTNQQWQLSYSAARFGCLPAMQLLQSVGCFWNESTCAYAAENGHLHILQYIRENGCPWDTWTCIYAAENEHLHVFQYALENDCPQDRWWWVHNPQKLFDRR